MADFEGYEIVVKPKKDYKNKLLRTGLKIMYVLFVLLCLTVAFLTGLVPLLALVPVFTWILIFYTWRYVNIEYEYYEESGVITFTKIYDNRARKKILTFAIRSAELIIPRAEAEERVVEYDPRREYDFTISTDDPEAYTALFVNDEGEKVALSFTVSERLKKSIRFYNRTALK